LNGGIGGATTTVLTADFASKYGVGKIYPDVAIWQVGVNDCNSDAGRDAFAANYATMVNTFVALCPNTVHVFCTNIINLDATIQARLVVIQGTYAANWAAFALAGIKFTTVDIFPVLTNAVFEGNCIDILNLPDGTHPTSTSGYPKIANAVYAAVQAAVALI
jgi:lysophospholipase L1-like esterase